MCAGWLDVQVLVCKMTVDCQELPRHEQYLSAHRCLAHHRDILMTESQPTPSKRRSWVPCGCLLAMFLSCVFVPFAGYMAWSFRASGQVDEQLARIRQTGLPTSFDEMDEFYRIERGAEDATQLYMKAQEEFSGSAFEVNCRDLPIVGNSEMEIPPPGQPWAQQQAVEEFLATYKDGIEALHEATAMGGAARFPLEFDQGFQMRLPHVQSLRTCSRMLSLEAHVKAHQGDAKGTTEAILAAVSIGKSLENQPIVVSQLVRIAMNGIAVGLTDQLLPYVDFSDEDLLRLQQAFRRDDFKAGLAHSLVGERVIGSEAFKSPLASLGPNIGMRASRFIRGSNEDLAFYLEIQSDLRDAMELEYPDALDMVETANDKVTARIATPLGRMRYIMTGLTLPAISASAGAVARADGLNRCIDTAIAIERYRRREGTLPESLAELVPDFLEAVPIDPFDGKPVRYIVKKEAYLVYTCGRDRVDDGGKEVDRTDDVIRIDLKSDEPKSAETISAETIS